MCELTDEALVQGHALYEVNLPGDGLSTTIWPGKVFKNANLEISVTIIYRNLFFTAVIIMAPFVL